MIEIHCYIHLIEATLLYFTFKVHHFKLYV